MPIPVDDYIRYLPPLIGLAPSFDGGTEAQQAWVTEALDACTYPWQRSPVPIVWGFSSDPAPAIHYEVAYTTNTPNTATDFGAIYNARADAILNPGLIAPTSSVYAGAAFAREVVVHELAHALLGSFDLMAQLGRITIDWQARFCSMFGASESDWAPDGTGGADQWKERVLEAVCETFKDVYLPRALRRYDNRTKWKLPRVAFEEFCAMFEGVATFRSFGSSPWRTVEALRSSAVINYNATVFEHDEPHHYTVDAIEEAPAPALAAIDVPPIAPYGGRVALRFLPKTGGRDIEIFSAGAEPYDLTDWTVSGRLRDDLNNLYAVFDQHNPSPADPIEAALTLPAGRTLSDWYIAANIVKVPFYQYTDNLDAWADGMIGQAVAWFNATTSVPPRTWPYREPLVSAAPAPVGTIRRGYRG